MSARIMPALIVLVPIGAVMVGLALAKPLTFAGVPLSAALSFLLGDIVRGAGVRAQDRLWAAWGGPPPRGGSAGGEPTIARPRRSTNET